MSCHTPPSKTAASIHSHPKMSVSYSPSWDWWTTLDASFSTWHRCYDPYINCLVKIKHGNRHPAVEKVSRELKMYWQHERCWLASIQNCHSSSPALLLCMEWVLLFPMYCQMMRKSQLLSHKGHWTRQKVIMPSLKKRHWALFLELDNSISSMEKSLHFNMNANRSQPSLVHSKENHLSQHLNYRDGPGCCLLI